MNDWLDSWTTRRKLPAEYLRSRKIAAVGAPGFKSARDMLEKAETLPAPSQAPAGAREASPGRMSYAETVKWLREKAARATTADR